MEMIVLCAPPGEKDDLSGERHRGKEHLYQRERDGAMAEKMR